MDQSVWWQQLVGNALTPNKHHINLMIFPKRTFGTVCPWERKGSRSTKSKANLGLCPNRHDTSLLPNSWDTKKRFVCILDYSEYVISTLWWKRLELRNRVALIVATWQPGCEEMERERERRPPSLVGTTSKVFQIFLDGSPKVSYHFFSRPEATKDEAQPGSGSRRPRWPE